MKLGCSVLPVVSIVMPVFNGARYIRPAIDSMLSQTFSDFELLVIDDGSTDDSARIVESYSDARIVLVRNGENRGLPFSRNLGISLARGEFVGFLDSDDVAYPNRLQVEVDFLRKSPGILGVGSAVENIDASGRVTSAAMQCPGTSEFCQAMLLFRIYFHTSTFLARKPPLLSAQFDSSIGLAEDYDLYLRLSRIGRLVNLPDVLVQYRVHGANVSSTKRAALIDALNIIASRELKALGLDASPSELLLHRHLEMRNLPPSTRLLDEIECWLRKILRSNEKTLRYSGQALGAVVGQRWFAVCEDSLRKGQRSAWFSYYRSNLRHGYTLSFGQHLKLAARLIFPKRVVAR